MTWIRARVRGAGAWMCVSVIAAASLATTEIGPDPIYFGRGEDQLSAEGLESAVWLAQWLGGHPGLWRLSIECHAFDEGGAAAEMELSIRRAETVRAALVNLGVPENLLGIKAWGSERPAVEGQTGTSDRLNRRCEWLSYGDLE
jgi:outer membrane protein OmpA-like peptidoglycan-associated protein